MVKIDLTNEQREKIEEKLCNYINNNDIPSKIKNLKELLAEKGYIETANTLSKQAENNKLFLLNDSCSLSATIKKFDNAIKKDTNLKKELIKLIKCGQPEIRNGDGIIIKKKVWGFEDIYKQFSKSDQAYDILNILGVNVCPYCNRQYTFTVRKKEKSEEYKSRPQFDHFYPKRKYPYLAMSIYSLVPSCGLCNQGKSDTPPENYLYPYEKSFEDKGIYFEVHNIVDNLLKQKQITVRLEPKKEQDKLIEQYNSSFKIELLYNEHNQYISELLQKNYVFNDDAIESIYNSYKELFNSQSELKQLIFGNCEQENFNQRPLSKFTNDILKQLNCK
jgi:hypothetical protein